MRSWWLARLPRVLSQAQVKRSSDRPSGTDVFTSPVVAPELSLSAVPSMRLLILADADGPTQKISFLRPLRPLIDTGSAIVQLVDEAQVAEGGTAFAERVWRQVAPTALVLSRYGGGLESPFVKAARATRTPIIYHIDDNLFEVPKTLGPAKYSRYNDPKRLADMTAAVEATDLVYASTDELARQLRERFSDKRVIAGAIYCAHKARVTGVSAKSGPVTIGYMGTSGHLHDLELVVPALVSLLEECPDLRFETFGTIKMPAALKRFQGRVAHHDAISDYEAFIDKLARLGWHVGLAPLTDGRFNACKADTKWAEYTAAGIPVVASNLPVYHKACAEGGGLLVGQREWKAALAAVVESSELRDSLVSRAQKRLASDYKPENLERQLLDVLELAHRSEH